MDPFIHLEDDDKEKRAGQLERARDAMESDGLGTPKPHNKKQTFINNNS
jgi:hypothetical protein